MISTLLTIVIPCKDSVYELKSTIEEISKQTRILHTRILVLDMESTDGSFQYASQASIEYGRILKIESIKYESDKLTDLIYTIDTKYSLVVMPGTGFKSKDFILESLNKTLLDGKISVFTTISNFLDRFFANRKLKNEKIEVKSLILPTNFLNSVNFKFENESLKISVDDGIINGDLKIIRGEISS